MKRIMRLRLSSVSDIEIPKDKAKRIEQCLQIVINLYTFIAEVVLSDIPLEVCCDISTEKGIFSAQCLQMVLPDFPEVTCIYEQKGQAYRKFSRKAKSVYKSLKRTTTIYRFDNMDERSHIWNYSDGNYYVFLDISSFEKDWPKSDIERKDWSKV